MEQFLVLKCGWMQGLISLSEGITQTIGMMSDEFVNLSQQVSDLTTEVSDLEARVAALEGEPT